MKNRKIQSALFKGLRYAFFYIALMLLISLFRQEWAGGGLVNILTIGSLFGLLLGLWELYYKKTIQLPVEKLPLVIQELEQLGFEQSKQSNNTQLHFIRKASEKLGFLEEVFIYKTTEIIEIESIQKYIRHLKMQFGE